MPPRWFAISSAAGASSQPARSSPHEGSPKRTAVIACVSQALLDQQASEVVKFLEVVARVGDLVRLVAEPADVLENLVEVNLLFRFGVRVVVAEVAVAFVKLGVAEVDRDGLRVTDLREGTQRSAITLPRHVDEQPRKQRRTHMQETVWFRREPRKDLPSSPRQVLLHALRDRLLVSSGPVQARQPALLEHVVGGLGGGEGGGRSRGFRGFGFLCVSQEYSISQL